jgi:hypothetical protein
MSDKPLRLTSRAPANKYSCAVLIIIGWSKHKKLITSDAKFKTLRFFNGLDYYLF